VGEILTPPDQLELAVSGLAGIVGLLTFPALGAWLRLVFRYIEADRTGLLQRTPRFSGLLALRAVVTTLALGFFVIALGRAAADLRDVRVEAPVFVSTATGFAVGIAAWVVVAFALRSLRHDVERRRQRREMRSSLR
jgi:hypothetical protein